MTRALTMATIAVAALCGGAAAAQDTAGQDPAAQDGAAPAADMNVGALYAAEGAGVTYDYCTPCHSEMLVAQQGQTRKGWDELLQWMVKEQGMQPIPEPDRTEVLDYLAENYNTDRPHFPR